MNYEEIPMLLKRCLAHGVKILPHRLWGVMTNYSTKKIPDDVLAKLDADDLEKYVQALYYCSCDEAGYWTEGHKMLKDLGFITKDRTEGHRVFRSMVWGSSDTEVNNE